jgi:hypothetical protein
MSNIILDNSYCEYCGVEDETVHTEHDMGNVCEICCDGISSDYATHLETEITDNLPFVEWVHLAFPERIIYVNWSEDDIEQYTALATQAGLTLNDFVVLCIKSYLNEHHPQDESS